MLKVSEKQAMILAAGFGTRLKPYSLLRPKPLFPLMDKPLLFHAIRDLQQAGFQKITVNAHHLREQFIEVLAQRNDIQLQLEIDILGTGGGLRLAAENMNSGPLLAVNGDIYHSIDLDWVYAQHVASGAKVTLVMHDFPRFNSVSVSNTDDVLSFGRESQGGEESTSRFLAFTGIHVIEPEVIHLMPVGVFYDIIECYRLLLQQGGTIKALRVAGHFWTDMGTPADYLALHGHLLHESAAAGGSLFFQGKNVRCGQNTHLEDWSVIGSRAIIGDDVSLTRCVVWDGADVPSNTHCSDRIIY